MSLEYSLICTKCKIWVASKSWVTCDPRNNVKNEKLKMRIVQIESIWGLFWAKKQRGLKYSPNHGTPTKKTTRLR
jgi:hypothetical protein